VLGKGITELSDNVVVDDIIIIIIKSLSTIKSLGQLSVESNSSR